MHPNLHLALHQARLDASLRRHRELADQRPRPPGRSRPVVARGLRHVADLLDGRAASARPA